MKEKSSVRNISHLQNLAKNRGGKCLSDKYHRGDSKYKWQCKEGHIWEASYAQLLYSNSWCPKCNIFFREEICRTTFEQIFETKFITRRFKWLKSSSNFPMELDGFSEKYNIAFEYQGQQHFQKNFWTTSNALLDKRILDDKIKIDLCNKRGIYLVIITYKDNLKNLPLIIKKRLSNLNFNIQNFDFDKNIDYNKAYNHKPKIDEMIKIAKERGGECISKLYIDSDTKLEWRCSNGHTFFNNPYNIKSKNQWCRVCKGYAVSTIEDMNKIAESRGGVCLSKKYINMYHKLEWQCEKKHRWFATPNMIKNKNKGKGTWCPVCLGRPVYILKDMQNIAKKRGGLCISTHYKNSTTKLEWKCSEGHKWFATPNNVINKKSWCPTCSRQRFKLPGSQNLI